MVMFHGVIPPSVTLFHADQGIDWDGTLHQLDALLAAGVHGVFALGTAGEWTQLSIHERKEYAQRVVERVNRRVPVIIGTGGVSTQETIELTRHAQGVGADAAAVVTPFYQRLDDAQVLAHFGAVANAVNLPIVVYNIPQFTGTAISTPVLAQLASENDNIVGVKDAWDSAVLLRSRILTIKGMRPDFAVLTGIPEQFIGLLMMGGDGGVFGEMNFAPAPFVNCYEAYRRGDYEAARLHFGEILRVASAIQVPGYFQATIKEAMRALGQTESATVRLPGTAILPDVQAQVRRNLEALGLLRTPVVVGDAPADEAAGD